MAKLTARGRTEVARLTQDAPETSDSKATYTLALMSDRRILQKSTITYPDGHTLKFGWANKGKLKDGVLPEQWIEARVKIGWKRT